MSDNKTPIELCIEALEKERQRSKNLPKAKEYQEVVERMSYRGGLEVAIEILKYHQQIEEEAIKKTCENRLTEAIKHIEQTRKYDFVSIEIRDNGSLWFVGHINIPYEGYDDYEIISVNEYFEKFKPE